MSIFKRVLAVTLLVFLSLPAWSEEATDGAVLYQRHCAVCHGADGDGGVGIPLNLPDFLAVADDRYLRTSIKVGRPGRIMPAFSWLSDEQVDALVTYIRSWAEQPLPESGTEALARGDSQRGAVLYAEHCAACHGESGHGMPGTGVTFSRPRDMPVMAPALSNHGFQESVSDTMLRATLLRGRDGTPMPSLEQLGLKPSDAADLIAHIRSLAEETPTESGMVEAPILRFESPYDLQQTVDNLKQAVVGRNFLVIREQYLESGLVEEGSEDPRQVMLYFCSFSFLNEALAIDPRVGLFLPCRITVLENESGVEVISINPKNLSRLFNNSELDKACQRMHDLYSDIMEEATF